ncbi:MAG: ABC transporter ATP-binding protein [Devosiaceae bacterium]|nr:ABC transporter ATP-binding protein [Devosiaceae bacterium]
MTNNEIIVEVQGLGKKFGSTEVLKGIDFSIPSGRIYGLIGHNGAGKTTAINALLGLTAYDGEVKVLGKEPFANRADLMADIAFISDVASLPRFLKVLELLQLMDDIHPNFNREKAEQFLSDTDIRLSSKIKSLSKGMLAQLHLSIVMAIDAKLLVLDEPTLGLDITFRKKFYRRLVEDYMSENRSILITTHQVDEIEFLLTDLIFLKGGEIVLDAGMDEISQRFCQIIVSADMVEQAKAQKPIFSTVQLGQSIMIFDGLEKSKAENFGPKTTPSVSDLFVALMEGNNSNKKNAQGEMQ